jgi:DNA-binding transcriptional LysR family regulator
LLSLSRREADLVFRIRPFDEPDVVQRKLTRIDYALYGTAGSRMPSAGDGAGCALVTMDAAFGDMPDVAWLRRMLPNARIAFRSNNRDVQAAMAVFGVGLAVLPRPIGDALDGLRIIDLGEPLPGRDVWIGYHQDLRRLARLRALVDLAVERFSQPPSRPLP